MTVMYFAWVKEKVGMSEETVSPPADVKTVGDLVSWLSKRSSGHEAAFADKRTLKAAVDQMHSPMSTSIIGAKEVAFFPPVTGG